MGCAATPAEVLLRDTQLLDPATITTLLKRAPVNAAEDVRVDTLLQSAEFSAHLLQVQTEYTRRLHRRHDLTILIHRGHGQVYLNDRRYTAALGDVFHIPRDTPYQILSHGPDPLAIIQIFTPPLVADDVIPIQPRARSYPRQ
ncbi:MAG: cupin domain-containing protein [Planctomycetota bacterium]